MSLQNTFWPKELYDYYQKMATRQHELLERLQQEAGAMLDAKMQVPPEQGQLLSWLIKVLRVEKALEVGTYGGYSSICIAWALPGDGHLITCDRNTVFTKMAPQFWQEAGVADKITLKLGEGVDSMEALVDTDAASFDFIFIDANKNDYHEYYELALKLVKAGGVIAIDNTLQTQRWLASQTERQGAGHQVVRELNQKIHDDDRVSMCMLPIGSGMTLLEKL
jgi:predicted O-methyltransferase YrrM